MPGTSKALGKCGPLPAEEDSNVEKVHGICYDQGTEMTARRKSSCEKVCNEGREAQQESS